MILIKLSINKMAFIVLRKVDATDIKDGFVSRDEKCILVLTKHL